MTTHLFFKADSYQVFVYRSPEFVNGGYDSLADAAHKAMKSAEANPGNRYVVLDPKGVEVASFQSDIGDVKLSVKP